MVQQEVGYRISDSPSDNPTIKKSDNPLPVRALILSQLILISSSGYIADGYEGFNDFFLSYDKIIKEHIASGDWEEVQPARKDENMLFEDAAYTHVMRKLKK